MPATDEKKEHERKKYEGIYSDPKRKGYGHTNHGKVAVPMVATKMATQSVLDVGCGGNEFKKEVLKLNPAIRVVGVDFACPFADVIAPADRLPFGDKEFDVLTAFDMLEHILPEQVDDILNEFARVSHRFMFSISYVPSINTFQGENLHPCVHAENWWIMQIMKAGGSNIKKYGNYIMGSWLPALRISPSAKVILVGNGPSTSSANGKVIDSFDEVVRFNTFHLVDKSEDGKRIVKDWRANVGSKTTLWSTFGKGTHNEIKERPDRVIYIHGETGDYGYKAKEEYRLQKWFYNRVGESVRSRNEWLRGLKGDPWRPTPKRELIASSGLLVAAWLLEVVQVDKLTLVGFDHFSKEKSNQHHYWLPGPFGKPREHDGDVEKVMFADLANAGRIEYI